MLRFAPSTASDLQLGADGHVPIIGGRSGDIPTWRRKQRTSRSFDTPGTRLQSVQNTSSRLICRLRRFDHVTDALVSLHWLRVPERVIYKITVLTFKVLHWIALEYLGPVVRVANLPGRQSFHSAGTNCLVVPPFKLSTIGTPAFPVASTCIRNSLPADNTSASSLSTFRQRLKTYLFRKSFTHLTV